jgi:6-pyruvoyltetrahydropterin/6-carboxytetrahydropterin synthase
MELRCREALLLVVLLALYANGAVHKMELFVPLRPDSRRISQTKMRIYKEFTFEAAHRLPNVPTEHKCARLHGHSFAVKVSVQGDVGENSGWVMDYADITASFKPIRDLLDHYYLNEIEGLENPTSENIVRWIWLRLKPTLPELCEIEIKETCTSGCIYTGNDS